MENLSATAKLLPGIGPGPTATVGGHGFDMSYIPGLDAVQKLFLKFGMDPSLLMTIGMAFTLLTSLFSFFSYSFGSFSTLTRFVSANLVSSATIHSSDVTYLYVMRWLAVNRISTDCRLFCVTSRKNPQSHAVRRYSSYSLYGDGSSRSSDDEDEDADSEGNEEDRLGPKLKYTPAPGYLWFWHKRSLFILHRKLDLSFYTGDIPDETLILTTIGRSPNLLRELLSEARRAYLESQSRKTMVYTLSPTPYAQKNWDQGRHRPSRDISTVIMPQKAKSFLLRDVKEYLNPVTARWYAQRGLPYRRGYLFYGPPGTGKTSFSLALAGELKVPLYILSLSTGTLTDETLTMLFVGLPRKCIVLLEDIDCAGVQRHGASRHSSLSDSEESDTESEEESESEAGRGKKSAKNSSKGSKKTQSSRKTKDESNFNSGMHRLPRAAVSFSGLLNAIDGVASHEGRILIMTTNHKERLDPALIRPGRVDVQMEFGYAGKETLAEIFCELYSNIEGIEAEEELFGGEHHPLLLPIREKSRGISPDKEKAYHEKIAKMAQSFAQKIPADIFTPAEVQGFLMGYKRKPGEALDRIDDWVEAKLDGEGGAKGKRRGGKVEKSGNVCLGSSAPEPTAPRSASSAGADGQAEAVLKQLNRSGVGIENLGAMIQAYKQTRNATSNITPPTSPNDVTSRINSTTFPVKKINGHAIRPKLCTRLGSDSEGSC